MMLRTLFLVAVVAAPAAFAAGMWQGQNHEAEAPVVGPRVNAPLIGKPGHGASDAGRYFAALHAPPPPPPPPREPPPAPPPPPDVAVLFRRDLSAVLQSPGTEPRIVLSGSRSLRKGDTYRDGWMLSNITSTTAVLTKGAETRNIGLFSPPPAIQTQIAAGPSVNFGPQISFSNSSTPGRPNAAQVAGVVSALRGAGMNQQQADRVSSMLASGTFDQGAATQMLNQMGRNNPMTPGQINNIVQSMARAGILQERQAQALAQSLPQMQNMQQVQQLMQMGGNNNRGGGGGGNRGGGGGGNRGPNQGFNAPGQGGPPPFPPPPPAPAPGAQTIPPVNR